MDDIITFLSSDPQAVAAILSAIIGAISSIITAIIRYHPATFRELFSLIKAIFRVLIKVFVVSACIVTIAMMAPYAKPLYQKYAPQMIEAFKKDETENNAPDSSANPEQQASNVSKPRAIPTNTPKPQPKPTNTPKPTPVPTSTPKPVVSSISYDELKSLVHEYLYVSNRGDVDELLELYDNEVSYFSQGNVSKSFIARDKRNYYKRWPSVTNSLEGQINVINFSDDNTKKLSFTLSFSVYNSSRRERISGTAENILIVRKMNGKLKIISENQKVLTRKKTKE
jgi:hypothetical protein